MDGQRARGWLIPTRRWFPLDGRMHKVWWHWSDVGLPLWPWRWLCWLNGGHVNDSYGSCVHCLAAMEKAHA